MFFFDSPVGRFSRMFVTLQTEGRCAAKKVARLMPGDSWLCSVLDRARAWREACYFFSPGVCKHTRETIDGRKKQMTVWKCDFPSWNLGKLSEKRC